MTLVILAAGMGSRYGGLKQIDPMTDHGEFIIDFTIFDAIRAGFDHVVFIIKEENLDAFRDTVGKRIEPFVRVSYAFQKLEDIPAGYTVPDGRVKPWGTTHALLAARGLVHDNFAVVNSDDYYGRDTIEKLAAHLKTATSEDGIMHGCMVGFELGNTLTENGTVSRGECIVKNHMLASVTERVKIKTNGPMAAYLADDGETWVDLPYHTVVSMNCWGFTPDVFDYLACDFEAFLKTPNERPLKCECFLPGSVANMMMDGKCDIRVYETDSVWIGVTYTEDKPKVKEAIRNLIDKGVYPEQLWKGI